MFRSLPVAFLVTEQFEKIILRFLVIHSLAENQLEISDVKIAEKT
jgi:hypothetical protein